MRFAGCKLEEVALFTGPAQVDLQYNSKISLRISAMRTFCKSKTQLWRSKLTYLLSKIVICFRKNDNKSCFRNRPPLLFGELVLSAFPTTHSQTLPYMGIKRIVNRYWLMQRWFCPNLTWKISRGAASARDTGDFDSSHSRGLGLADWPWNLCHWDSCVLFVILGHFLRNL